MRDFEAIRAKCEKMRDDIAEAFLAIEPEQLIENAGFFMGIEKALNTIDAIEWGLATDREVVEVRNLSA